jgi:Uma2 family endonuclease
MSTDIATKKMTAEEFADWVQLPENADKWFELVRGEVIELPPPYRPHGVVANNIGRILGNYTFQIDKGYVASNDSGVILERDPDTVRGPDIAVFEDAASFAEVHPKYGEVPPRLAVEVLSPNDRADRVIRKINDYLRNGVEIVWLVDPETRSVTIYQSNSGPREIGGTDEITAEEVLPGFRCSVAEFFRVPGKADKPKDQPNP